MLKTLAGLIIGALAALLAAEGVLQALPVNSGVRLAGTDKDIPYARYIPDQSYEYSVRWDLMNARAGRLNDLGFANSPTTVEPGGVLVLGDSYIEAFMLPYEQTLQGRLEKEMPKRVMAIGLSGNGLADELVLAERFAREKQVKDVVVFVEPYDLSTLLEDKAAEGHVGFREEGGKVTLEQNPYVESPLKTKVGKSALVRYVYYNLKFPSWMSAQIARLKGSGTAHAAPADDTERKARVVRYFLQRLKTSLGEDIRPILLVDADRKRLYGHPKVLEGAWNLRDRALLLDLASQEQVSTVDLQPAFAQHRNEQPGAFDYLPQDGHWNEVGHAIAARELLAELKRGRGTSRGESPSESRGEAKPDASGAASTTPLNSVDTIVADMREKNDGPLKDVNPEHGFSRGPGYVVQGNQPRGSNGPDYWRKANPKVVSDEYWNYLMPWNVVFEGEGNTVQKRRVHFRNMKAWIRLKDSGRWTLATSAQHLSGEVCDQGSNYFHCPGKPDARVEPDGGMSMSWASGKNFHGYFGGPAKIEGRNIGALMITMHARLIPEDASGAKEIGNANFLLQVGADYYPKPESSGIIVPSAGISRAKRLSTDWQAFSMTTFSDVGVQEPGGGITEAEFRRHPPPLD